MFYGSKIEIAAMGLAGQWTLTRATLRPRDVWRHTKVKSTLISARGHLQTREIGYNGGIEIAVMGTAHVSQGAKRAGVWCKSGGRGRGASSRSSGPNPRACGSRLRRARPLQRRRVGIYPYMPTWVVPRSAFVPWGGEAYYFLTGGTHG